MPLHQRQVSPINVGRKYLGKLNDQDVPDSVDSVPYSNIDTPPLTPTKNYYENYAMQSKSYVTNSKEEAANRIVANMIRQLASLSQNAHGIFGNPKHLNNKNA